MCGGGGIGFFFFTNNWIFFNNKKKLLPNTLLAIKNIAICILVKVGKYRYLHIGEFWELFSKEIRIFKNSENIGKCIIGSFLKNKKYRQMQYR